MKRILIDGNGLFYNFPDLKLSINEIHKRIDDDFIIFDRFLFENAPGSSKIMRILDIQPIWEFSVFIGTSQWFLDAINKYRELMKDGVWNKNFEEKIGEVIDFCFSKMNLENPEDIKKFKYIYEVISSVTLALIFMYHSKKTPILDVNVPRHDKRFTFNYDYFSYIPQRNVTFLHGKYRPKKNVGQTEQLRLQYSGDELIVRTNWYDGIRETMPPVFGKTIDQKNKVVEILSGKTIKQIREESTHLSLKQDLEENLLKLFPYHELKYESSNSEEIHIFGVSPKSHKDILKWINKKNKIIYYHHSTKDLKEIKAIQKEFPEYNIHHQPSDQII